MKKSTDELYNVLKSKKNYSDFIKQEYDELYFETVGEYLNSLMAQKGLKKSEVIKKSNVDKHYAYQIFNSNRTNPSRDKLIMIAFGMGLDMAETTKLLKVAGVPNLYIRHPRDSVIMFCIEHKMSLMDTNEKLFEMSMDILD